MPNSSSIQSIASWFDHVSNDGAVRTLVDRLHETGDVFARGIAGSSAVMTAAAIRRALDRPMLIVVAHLDDADEICDELEPLNLDARRFPAIEIAPGESGVSVDLVAERLSLVRGLGQGVCPDVIVAPIQALMQTTPAPGAIGATLKPLVTGDRVDLDELLQWLAEAEYSRVEALESPGEFAVRGGIVDVFPPGGMPIRVDFFGDEIDQINEIDLETMGSDRTIKSAELVAMNVAAHRAASESHVLAALMPEDTVAVLHEIGEITEQGRSYFDRVHGEAGVVGPPAVFQAIDRHLRSLLQINQYTSGDIGDGSGVIELPARPLPEFAHSAAEAVRELAACVDEGTIIIPCQNDGELSRMNELLAEFAADAPITTVEQYVHRGFIWGDPAESLVHVIPFHELFHRFQARRKIRRVGSSRAMDAFVDLQPGDYVVHRDHGIARYLGLGQIDVTRASEGDATAGGSEEFLTLEFAKGAKLHVPATKINLIQKYIGAYKGAPQLSTLGGRKWKTQKEKVGEAVKDLAAEMLRIQAARAALPGTRYPADTVWQHEFEAEFPYEETDDQLAAIAAIKKDLSGSQPMDRLVCGDVGFGKTEVAIRAAFKVAEFGKQVAVLVPTTVLAEQHERTFRQRFAAYPFVVESLSRFKTRGEQQEVLKRVAKGEVDILIGTHRIVSKDVKFADLGLVVIDEEQRFGVEHKQRLLELRATVDVLTMTATPIPRTLHMAMLGLRDISSLTTAPLDRRAIVTELIPFNPHRIKQAIERELAREGQIFFVHNRVHDIHDVAQMVQGMAPDAEVIVGHGQMPPKELEKVMLQFIRGKADILVSTTIIESGIDIGNANTMIIHDCHMFGMSELHQLRGRVGRHKNRAYCYLVLPEGKRVNDTAMKRLRAIESFSMLGAGFKIAMRDLEIRGAGNLLGAEQSGHISVVGYEMYCQLLEQAVDDLQNRKKVSTIDTIIDIGLQGALPKGYIPSTARRLDAYRRICQAESLDELERIERDLVSAYRELPKSASMLVQLAEIRIAATLLNVQSMTRRENDLIFRTRNPRLLEAAMSKAKGTLRFVGQPDDSGSASIYYRPPVKYFQDNSLLAILRRHLVKAAKKQVQAAELAAARGGGS